MSTEVLQAEQQAGERGNVSNTCEAPSYTPWESPEEEKEERDNG